MEKNIDSQYIAKENKKWLQLKEAEKMQIRFYRKKFQNWIEKAEQEAYSRVSRIKNEK